ncbi:MAG TPA: C40 family peptidase [Flavisolibacter sp.]|jgi:cell wall-associated NlpC family hydrolase|nr:C40 family peptidase [Flavisolibacter sp.]
MQPAICLLSVVPMRKEPSHRSEIVSQILFGEYVSMGEEKDDFVWVQCLYDGYEGWVQATQLTPVKEVLNTSKYVGSTEDEVLLNGYTRMISIGSPVYQPGEQLVFGKTKVQYLPGNDSLWDISENKNSVIEKLENVCLRYLYTPYLWGGKSIYGIDCSGFAQQVLKLFGVKLLRDAYLQAEQGTTIAHLEDAKLGDLAFFQNEKGRVTHVGILLSNESIIHAAGRVRVDTIDKSGITNTETGKRTHQLCAIRRFF